MSHAPRLGAALACVLACDPAPAASPPASAPEGTKAATPVVQRLGFVSDLKSDEELRLFPAVAVRSGDGWDVRLRAWVFEPEEDSWRRSAALAGLASLLELPAGSESNAVFQRRARAFFFDNEGGKRVVVQIGLKEHALEYTQSNGHSETVLKLTDADLATAATPVTAVLGPADGRTYATKIFRLDPDRVSVVSDVDDTIKISEVRDKARLLERTFLKEFEPVPGMAAAYGRWSEQGATFHYLSASPWQLYDPLAQFTATAGFPAGSLHLKQFRAKDSSFWNLFQDPKAYKGPLLTALITGSPGRRFVLVGDSGELDPEVYGDAYRQFPTQVAAICIRDVTGEGREAPRYRTAFDGVPADRWLIFTDPTDLPPKLP